METSSTSIHGNDSNHTDSGSLGKNIHNDHNEIDYAREAANNKTFTVLFNLIEEAKKLKLEGNTYFTAQNYEAAEATYSRGLKVVCSLLKHFEKRYPRTFQEGSGGDDEGKRDDIVAREFLHDVVKTKVALFSNQAFVLNKLGRYNDTDKFCSDALMEMKEEIADGIIPQKTSSPSSTDSLVHRIEQVMLSGQIKSEFFQGQIRK